MAMAAVWIEAIGLLAGIIGIFAWIPQIIQVWVHKRHDGISLTTFAVVSFALGLWLVYGILVDSFAMIAANIMTLTVIGAVIIGVLKVRKNEHQSEENQL
jgi:MtN3 and saliva related transmembrane protein|tara:strand:+ start:391 stop:690 length:300 start_codon:yes stop_codon:yes gene_type:complete